MARTTSAEVLQIMDGCTLSSTIIDAYILAANALLDKVFYGDSTLGTVVLEEVERWLTAHMIASTTWRTSKSESVGQVSVTYTGDFKEGLSSTPYGQMVLSLDFTGKMGNLGKRKASIFAITSFD